MSSNTSGGTIEVDAVSLEEGLANRLPSKTLAKSFIMAREKSRTRLARSTVALMDAQIDQAPQAAVGPLRTSLSSSSEMPTAISEAYSIPSKDSWRWGKKSWIIIRRHPVPTVLLPLLLLAVLVALGVYGVIAASNAYTSNLHVNAYALVDNAGRSFCDQVNLVWSPQATLSKLIEANPSVEYWRRKFNSTANDLLDEARDQVADGAFVMLQIQPHGTSRLFADPYLSGLLDGSCTDLLTSPGNPQQAAFMLNIVKQGKAVLNGPMPTTDSETGRVYPISAWLIHPIFVEDVSKDEDFGYSYSDSPASVQCVESGPCYNATLRKKWWGFVTSFFDFEPLISGNQSSLMSLVDHGFSLKLTAPDPWTQRPVVIGQVGQVLDASSVRYKFSIPYDNYGEISANPWVLSIYPNDGWVPQWKNPLIAAVVVLSVILSLLVSITVVGIYRQRDLLKDSCVANGKLVSLAKNLEEEKKNSDALVARQLALIECLGREAEEAQSHRKVAEREKKQRDSGSLASLECDQKGSVLSVQQIDIIRKELVGRTSKMTSRATLGEGYQIPDLEIKNIIGEGSFGKVYKCLWRGSPVALKKLLLPANMSRQEKREKMAVMEAAISSSLSHPNICSTYTYSINEMKEASRQNSSDVSGDSSSPSGSMHLHLGYEVQLVLEYCDLGCLRTFLDNRGFYDVELPMTDGDRHPCLYSILTTARDIASAMAHMHDCNIMHLDLKARNVMLKSYGSDTRGFVAKVADFGLASKLPDDGATHESGVFQGTLSHMAPEMMTDGRVSRASDVYAFGILLWELYTGEKPWKGINRAHLAWEVTKAKKRPEFPIEAPREYVDLAIRCWADSAADRPTFETAHRTILDMLKLIETAMSSK